MILPFQMSYSTDIVLYSVVLLVSSREHFDFLVGAAQGPASLSVSCLFFVHSLLKFLFSPTPGHMDSEASRADRKIFFFFLLPLPEAQMFDCHWFSSGGVTNLPDHHPLRTHLALRV